ncbi:MAG: hypothetical protein ACT4OO_03280 [Nitrospiraceae bacterium]
MKSRKTFAWALAGLLPAIGLAVSAQAQTPLNVAGASAAKPFVEEVPILLCDNPMSGFPNSVSGAANPRMFIDVATIAGAKFITWTCAGTNPGVGLPSLVFRYQSTGSSDGIDKIRSNPGTAGAQQVYVLENTASCGAPLLAQVHPSGRTFDLYPSCTQFSPNPGLAGAIDVTLGVSDVDGSSFGQTTTGWNGGVIQGSIVSGPRSMVGISTTRPVVVPFAIVLGSAVKQVNPSTGAVIGNVPNLTQLQVEGLLSRNITSWTQLNGIGADTNGDNVVNGSDTQTVVICGRRAGSGTKAALDQTILKDANEHTGASPANSATFNLTLATGAGPTSFWGISNSDVRDCIQGNSAPTIPSNDPFPFPGPRPAHPTAIAYMEAEQAATVNPAAGYVVSVDGGQARRLEVLYAGNQKENQRCGKFQYWVFEAFNTRETNPPVGDQLTLVNAYLATVEDPNVINNLPIVGAYWTSPQQMRVTKNADKGPVLWKSLAQQASMPTCVNTGNNLP